MGSIPRVRRDKAQRREWEALIVSCREPQAVPKAKLGEKAVAKLYNGCRYSDARVPAELRWRPPLSPDRPWQSSLASLVR